MAERTARILIELVGVDSGLWCNTCQLSTGFLLYYSTRPDLGGRMTLRSKTGCTEAERDQHHQVEPRP